MRVVTTRDVGALIRQGRRSQSMTQAELAAAAGVTRRWLSDIEHGAKPRAELGLVLAALNALDIKLDATYPSGSAVSPDESSGGHLAEPPLADQRVSLDDALDRYTDG